MNTLLSVVGILLLVQVSSCYSLPGQWKLKNLDGQSASVSIILKINEQINKDNRITNLLQFSNCNQISYQVNVNQNYMWFDDKSTNKTNSNTDQSSSSVNLCSQEESNLQKRISQTLKKVFFFAIKNDLLVFVSPNGNDLFQFSRIQKVYLKSLIGNWILDQIYWRRAEQSLVKVNQQKFIFCQGNVQATYSTNNIDQIRFNITKNQPCQEENITKALPNIRYFRLKDNQLELYNEDSVENIQLYYKDGGDIVKQTEKIVQNRQNQAKGGAIVIIADVQPEIIGQEIQSSNLRIQSSTRYQSQQNQPTQVKNNSP